MELSPVIPMLYTRELQPTIDFYVKTLGFTCGDSNEEWGWASLHRNGCEIMLARPNEHTPFDKPNFTGSLYIRTTDSERLWDEWKDKANVCYPLEIFDWGMKEFGIYDNNGYLLQFGEVLD